MNMFALFDIIKFIEKKMEFYNKYFMFCKT